MRCITSLSYFSPSQHLPPVQGYGAPPPQAQQPATTVIVQQPATIQFGENPVTLPDGVCLIINPLPMEYKGLIILLSSFFCNRGAALLSLVIIVIPLVAINNW